MNRCCTFIACCFVLLLSSCADRAIQVRLEAADSLMWSAPDSAYHILQAVAPDSLSTDGQRAYYGVLMAQAKHKNFVPLADDSLVAHSVIYYRDRDDYNYGRAQNYLGLVCKEREFYGLATEAYKEALVALSESEDFKMRALIRSNLGWVYGQQFFSEKAIAEYQQACALFSTIGDTLNLAIQYNLLGSLYLRVNQFDSSYAVRRRALHLLGERDFLSLRAEIQVGLSATYRKDQRLGQSRALMDSVLLLQGGMITSSQYNVMAFLMRDLGQLDSAHYYLDHDPLPHHTNYRLRSQLYEQQGEWCLSLASYKVFKRMTDSIFYHTDSVRVDEITARYDYTQIAKEKERLKTINRVAVGLWLLGVVLVVGGMWWWRRRTRRQLHAVWQLVESFKNQPPVPAIEAETSLREARLRRAIEKRLALVGEIIALSYEYRDQSRTLAHKIDELVARNPLKSEVLKDIFEVVDSGYRGLVEHLRTHYPKLNESELQICALTCVGYTPHHLFLILNAKNIEAIYNKKYYINSKLGGKGDLRDTLIRIVETLP